MDARIAAARADARQPPAHPWPSLPARRSDQVRRLPPATRSGLPGRSRAHPDADYIVFCGVHFMAESADVLAAPHQQVILPDLAAGCSMADMVEPDQLENCWEELTQMGVTGDRSGKAGVVPVTYINSAASIKAFVGERGGTVCTSSNAAATLKWAFARGEKVLFLPDQHLGPQHRLQDGHPARRHGRVGSERDLRRPRSRPGREGEDDPLEGSLLRPHPLLGRADRGDPEAASRASASSSIRRCRGKSCRRPTTAAARNTSSRR